MPFAVPEMDFLAINNYLSPPPLVNSDTSFSVINKSNLLVSLCGDARSGCY